MVQHFLRDLETLIYNYSFKKRTIKTQIDYVWLTQISSCFLNGCYSKRQVLKCEVIIVMQEDERGRETGNCSNVKQTPSGDGNTFH